MRTPWVVAVLGVVAVAACASPAPPPREPDVAWFPADEADGGSATTWLTLVREDGCTYVLSDADWYSVAAFPDVGMEWDGDELVVGRQRYRLGTRVELPTEVVMPDEITLPDACREGLLVHEVRQT